MQKAPVSARQPAGEYQVSYVLSAPEGWYNSASTDWQPPKAGTTAHLRVFVRDRADGRLVPGVQVQAAFVNPAGQTVLTQTLPYGWYPLLEGYGDNLILPPGAYRLNLSLSAMPFRRHDPYNGDRFGHPAEADFASVTLPAGLSGQPPLTEAEEKQTTLMKIRGEAYHETTLAMYKQANDGKNKPVGDYRVGYAIEYAEAYWYFPEMEHHNNETAHSAQSSAATLGKLYYTTKVEASARRNGHVEISVQDERTGRFMPGLRVTGTLTDAENHNVGTQAIPFMWHPWLYHYGENWRVNRSGTYHLHVHADAPPTVASGAKRAERWRNPSTRILRMLPFWRAKNRLDMFTRLFLRRAGVALLGFVLFSSQAAQAQRNFYRVYQYESPLKSWLEATLWNTVVQSSPYQYKHFDAVYPREGLSANSFELEYGITDRFSFSLYGDAEAPAGSSLKFTQARFVGRYRLARRYIHFFNTSLYFEYDTPRPGYAGQEVETRVILAHDFNDFRLALNPSLRKAVTGEESTKAPNLLLDAGLYYRRFYAVQPGIEVYTNFGEVGPFSNGSSGLFTTLDLRLFKGFNWNIGAGFPITSNADRFTLKSILMYQLGSVRPDRIFHRGQRSLYQIQK